MAKTNQLVLVMIVALIAITGLSGFFVMQSLSVTDTGNGGDTSSDGTCAIAPSLTTNVKDALNQATSISTDEVYRVNGEYFESLPSLAKGDEVQVLANASGYIDVISEVVSMDCGSNKITLKTGDYSAPTVEIKEDNTVLTDSATGGASNGSAITAGGQETFEVVFTGNDKDTTGEFIYVIEAGTNSNVSEITMYDPANNNQMLEEAEVPSFYSNTRSSPEVVAFKVPEVVNNVEKSYKIGIKANSGDTISGAVYTTAYVGEPIVESDGTFTAYGIENSDGDSDYEETFDEDFYLA